jgi:hypothetical protein
MRSAGRNADFGGLSIPVAAGIGRIAQMCDLIHKICIASKEIDFFRIFLSAENEFFKSLILKHKILAFRWCNQARAASVLPSRRVKGHLSTKLSTGIVDRMEKAY